MKLPYNTHRVANLLTLHGIPTEDVSDGDELQDGEIKIKKGLYVQVGEDYTHIVQIKGHLHEFDDNMRDYRPGQLVNRLKELLR
ncbi:MAG: hypothetical protein ACTSUU_06860 [Candidatus Thorarchaeota archaeon]